MYIRSTIEEVKSERGLFNPVVAGNTTDEMNKAIELIEKVVSSLKKEVTQRLVEQTKLVSQKLTSFRA
jgi:hypothetical protein